MKFLLSTLVLLIATPSFAASDEDVFELYELYSKAISEGDNYRANKYAKLTYELAEEVWGDTRADTARLAANYGNELSRREKWGAARSAYTRCIEISLKFEEELRTELDCRAGLANVWREMGENEKLREQVLYILDFAEPLADENAWAAKAAGEAYLQLALVSDRAGTAILPRGTALSGETSSRIRPKVPLPEIDPDGLALAIKAVDFLEKANEGPSVSLAQAYRIAGNYSEFREDYVSAKKYYQSAYDVVVAMMGENSPTAITMSGRLAVVNEQFIDFPQYPEPTREPSSKRCAIHVRGDNEIEACRDKRYPPYFPNKALFKDQQGFVYLEYDILETGETANVGVFYSWPGGIFDERSVEAAEKWTFFPPKDQNRDVRPIEKVITKITFTIVG